MVLRDKREPIAITRSNGNDRRFVVRRYVGRVYASRNLEIEVYFEYLLFVRTQSWRGTNSRSRSYLDDKRKRRDVGSSSVVLRSIVATRGLPKVVKNNENSLRDAVSQRRRVASTRRARRREGASTASRFDANKAFSAFFSSSSSSLSSSSSTSTTQPN